MSLPVVWSEREYPHYRDCAFSMALDLLVFSGFTNFPLGIYSTAEREAFERAGSHVAETGTSIAQVHENLKNRYSLDFPALDVPIDKALTHIGTGLGLFGINGNLPQGDSWRRWDPSFTGIHAVSVYPLGNGVSRVLDPEAPMGFQGDIVSNTKILRWHSGRSEAIVAKENQFQKQFLGYRLYVHSGRYQFWEVERYIHTLKNPWSIPFSRDSGAPVWHGIPGFWEVAKGALKGRYIVYGRSGTNPWEISAVYRLGNGKIIYIPVNPAS